MIDSDTTALISIFKPQSLNKQQNSKYLLAYR